MPRIFSLLVPALLLCTTACASAGMSYASGGAGSGAMAESVSARSATQQERQVIQTASMRMTAQSPAAVARTADSLAVSLGGFVESSDSRGGGDARMTLRVPANSLTAVMDQLAGLGRVQHRSTRQQDVTEQVTDVDARLANLRTLRDRLRVLQSQAGTVNDLVAVERELARTQGEIDALEARQRGLAGRVALAALDLNVDRPRVLGPLGWVLNGVATVIGKLFVIR